MRDTEGARSDAELSRKEVRTHPHPSHVTHTSCSPPQALEANAIAAKAVELAKAADSAKTELKETRSELERTRAKLSQATNKAKQVEAMAQRNSCSFVHGVLHAAGVTADQLVIRLEASLICTVLSPKAVAAACLHVLTSTILC